MQLTLSKLVAMNDDEIYHLIKNMPKATYEGLYEKLKDHEISLRLKKAYYKVYPEPTRQNAADMLGFEFRTFPNDFFGGLQ